jgi:serine/threonine protein kinase/tetratricopeptide (TPR) repeat protein
VIGSRLGPYELLEEIGKGGMATVYRAYQPSTDRQVAVKVIQRSLADNAAELERFQREARMIARLEHAHILPVYDYNGAHAPPYIVMRYLPGGTLKDVLSKSALLFDEVVRLYQQIGAALDYAHQQGVVHLDIKPSNIMLDNQDNVFLTDFGIARLTGFSTNQGSEDNYRIAVGTPAYMAPENLVVGGEIGPATDVYALGVMLFELLTGELPFAADSPAAMAHKHIHDLIPSAYALNPALPPAVDDVIAKALAKRVEERYGSAGELANAIMAVLGVTTARFSSRAQAWLASPGKTEGFARSADRDKLRAPVEQQKQVTALHADASEFERSLYETADAESAREVMSDLWARVATAISGQGGAVFKRTDTSIALLWGVDVAREDDPERAIRTAIGMREATRRFATDDLLPLQIGLTVGNALIAIGGAPASPTTLTSTPHFSDFDAQTLHFTNKTPRATLPLSAIRASGLPINIASRLTVAHPEGGVVISHDMYRLVRGVFDVEVLPPLRVRGLKEPLQTYLVLDAKPRALRVVTRGVEGVETRMIGREVELKHLQDAWESAYDGDTQLVTVLGETGVGKSRLLYEFDNWSELRHEVFWLFRGRATPEMVNRPYALLRDVFMFRFEIQDSDSTSAVRDKMEKGIVELSIPPAGDPQPHVNSLEQAHFIGQLLGFNFSYSQYLREALKDASRFHERAVQHLLQFFRAVSGRRTSDLALMILEDLHWADRKSLEVTTRLVQEMPDAHLMIACAARPALLERYPSWGTSSPHSSTLTLSPLSKRDSRKLVKEVLQKVDSVPDDLRDLIAERSEGNPLYIEELVKVLIEDRVIVKGEPAWTIQAERLSAMRVPPTLTGILQARLDSLNPDERTALQRAAVIGRTFWGSAVQALEEGDNLPVSVPEALASLQKRELIYRRDPSSFATATEYMFASNMLRDVVYESVPKRQKRAYHTSAARWLLEAAGERASAREYTALIAEHYEQAGEVNRAVEQLQQTGDHALNVSAYPEAISIYERALALLPPDSVGGSEGQHALLLIRLGKAHEQMGQLATAEEYLRDGLSLARDSKTATDALSGLCIVFLKQGQYEAARDFGARALSLASGASDWAAMALALRRLGMVDLRQGRYPSARRYFEDSLTLYRGTDDREGISACLNNLGIVAISNGDLDAASQYLIDALAMARELGERVGIGVALGNLGEVARARGDLDSARQYFEEALEILREIGVRGSVVGYTIGLGFVLEAQGHDGAAAVHFRDSLTEAMAIGAQPRVLYALTGLASLLIKAGELNRAAELLGLALNHPACDDEVTHEAEPLLEHLRSAMPRQDFDAAIVRGKDRTLEEVVNEILTSDSHVVSPAAD